MVGRRRSEWTLAMSFGKSAFGAVFLTGLLASFSDRCGAWEPRETDWNKRSVADYLDARATEWLESRVSNRGNGTSCVACHTGLPYALSRPLLRRALNEKMPSDAEKQLIAGVRKRVQNWTEIKLYYESSQKKIQQSRGTESILNALILANFDAQNGNEQVSNETKAAFVRMWEEQVKTGPSTGAWHWLAFGLEPWESEVAQYFGASLAAVAVGTAPGGYSDDASIQAFLTKLRKYLKDRFEAQSLHNRLTAMWADSKIGGVLSKLQKKQLVLKLISQQNEDGGWALSDLGDWRIESVKSDGYATGLVAYVMMESGVRRTDEAVSRALSWLASSQIHQDGPLKGSWPARSANKERHPHDDNKFKAFVGKFMYDAAAAYSVLALTKGE